MQISVNVFWYQYLLNGKGGKRSQTVFLLWNGFPPKVRPEPHCGLLEATEDQTFPEGIWGVSWQHRTYLYYISTWLIYCDFMFCCFYVLGSDPPGVFIESGDIKVQSINISTFFNSRNNNFFPCLHIIHRCFLFITGQECLFQNWEHYYSGISKNGFVLMRITSTQAKQDTQLLLPC